MNSNLFGARVRDARHLAHLTSEELSELCECTPISIRQIESGARLASLPKLVCLCNALKVTPTQLLKSELTFLYDESRFSEQDRKINNLMRKMSQLSDSQLDLVCATVEAMIDHLTK